MEILCTRSGCPRPQNFFGDLDDNAVLKTVQQKYCITCGMPLILVGRYLPTSLFGRGGFGAAFLARDRYTPTMRRCVVKQFQPAGDLTPQQLQLAQNLFEREGEVLEDLGTHAQIPDLYAFFEIAVPGLQPGKEEKYFYLVQEFIDGQTLEQELEQKGKFSQSDILVLLRAILPVLKFVHERGSIHRDIKPSNIMRHRNGVLYLLDFGAVKQIAKGTPGGKSTGIYSMGFAPPEQMAGGQVYPSTDLYALAVTCLELLTGKQPTELFDAYNNQWNWRTHAQVSDRLAAILDKMLLPAPNQRFPSVDDVIAALSQQQPPTVTSVKTPPKPSTPTPAPIQPSAQSTPPASLAPSRPAFSLLEVLGCAGFTGFEGGLVYITLTSLLSLSGISMGLLGMILGGLIFAQNRRIIEKVDLVIIAGITLAVIWFVPGLILTDPKYVAVIMAAVAGAVAIAIAALFRLIYLLLSSFLK